MLRKSTAKASLVLITGFGMLLPGFFFIHLLVEFFLTKIKFLWLRLGTLAVQSEAVI